MKCERCKKDIPLQHGFSTNSLILRRAANERIITPLCDECATDIFSDIDNWLNKKRMSNECSHANACDSYPACKGHPYYIHLVNEGAANDTIEKIIEQHNKNVKVKADSLALICRDYIRSYCNDRSCDKCVLDKNGFCYLHGKDE